MLLYENLIRQQRSSERFITERMPSFSAFLVLVLFLQIFLVQNVGSAPTPIDELEARHEGHSDSEATPSPTSVVALDFQHKNGVEAQKLNAQFKALKATDGCQGGFSFF